MPTPYRSLYLTFPDTDGALRVARALRALVDGRAGDIQPCLKLPNDRIVGHRTPPPVRAPAFRGAHREAVPSRPTPPPTAPRSIRPSPASWRRSG